MGKKSKSQGSEALRPAVVRGIPRLVRVRVARKGLGEKFLKIGGLGNWCKAVCKSVTAQLSVPTMTKLDEIAHW